MIRTRLLVPGSNLVLLAEPTGASPGVPALCAWAAAHREAVHQRLLEHGALLFRGFGPGGVAALDAFAQALEPQLQNYVEGNSPRTRLSSKVYTSTEYPPNLSISQHNELSYAHWWPRRLYLGCEIAPATGGETPLCDSRRVLRALPDALQRRFEVGRVRYRQNLPASRGLGRSWPDTFETTDRAVVERYLRGGDVQFEWLASGGLRTSQVREAVRAHPVTGEALWFNQADQWHPSNLPATSRAQLLKMLKEEDLPLGATFGDGAPIDDADLDTVRACCQAEAVCFAWEPGDLLMVDNMLVAHGRRPFSGPRRVLIAMA